MAQIEGRVTSPAQLGDAIRQGREIQGWSQRELAGRLGVTQKWLWELEQGKPGLLMERLFAALRTVDVTLLAEFDDPQFDDPQFDDPQFDDPRSGHTPEAPAHRPERDEPASS